MFVFAEMESKSLEMEECSWPGEADQETNPFSKTNWSHHFMAGFPPSIVKSDFRGERLGLQEFGVVSDCRLGPVWSVESDDICENERKSLLVE